MISASTQHVGRGVDQVDRTGVALSSIVNRVAHISTLISDIAAGAGEQSSGLAEINMGVTQLDQVTQQNAAMVEQSTAASHSLNQEASDLSDLVGQFVVPADGRSSVGNRSRLTERPKPAKRAEPMSRKDQSMTQLAARPMAAGPGVWQEF